MVGKINNWSASKRIAVAVLSVAVVLSAATAAMVPLLNDAKAAGETPGTAAYYEARWEEAKVRFNKVETGTAYTDYQGNPATTAAEGPWMVEDLQGKVERGELSAPWNGVAAGTAPTETVNGGAYDAATNPWKVSTAEEFRWCLTKFNSFQLQRDIDLAGYTGTQWTTPSSSSGTWVADGNGHTIYNYYVKNSASSTSLFGQQYSVSIRNLRIANSFLSTTGGGSSPFLGGGGATVRATTIENCALEMTWVQGKGAGIAGFAGSFRPKAINQSYIKNCVIYGASHVAAMAAYNGAQTYTNTFAVDSVVISSGSHSGGFASCVNDFKIENCFTSNVDMYANSEAGNFYSRGTAGAAGSIKNCFSSGKMEGVSDLGGFIAGEQNYLVTVTNCYTTTMTGLVSDGYNLGGFVGAYMGGMYGGSMYFENCYAAGEVGSIDTIVTPDRTSHKTVGGFVGGHNGKFTYVNCYYDKQTTGMREWESGDTLDGVSGDIAGITGMLTTTTTKSGVGMTDPNWTALGEAYNNNLGEGYYPQLNIFTYPYTFSGFKGWTTDEEIQELVRACSVASVSTVQLDTWEKDYAGNPLPETTYDTVRDITGKFPMTSGSGSVSGIVDVPVVDVDTSVNVALNKTVTCSSNYGAFVAANVVDGSTSSIWATASTPGIGEWICVDLGKPMGIGKISVYQPNSNRLCRKYELLYSKDAREWTSLTIESDVTTVGYRHSLVPEGITARYIKLVQLEIPEVRGNFGEIEVYPRQEYITMPGYDYSIAQWERCGVTGQGTLNNGTGAQSGVDFGESLHPEVIQLVDNNGQWMGTQPMPGIDWVRVTTSVGNSSGYRSLRICPTVGMDAGLSQYLGSNIPYDHADDVRLAYSTGGRMDKGDQYITYGVFPDTPLAEKQETYLNNSDLANTAALIAKFAEEGQNNAFTNVDVAHMERTSSDLTSAPIPINDTSGVINEVIIRPVLKENGDGSVELGDPVNLTDPEEAARWNGEKPFSDGTTQEIYDIEYVWSLTDGRFLRDSKRVEVSPQKHNVILRVENVNGEAMANRAYLDAYSISDGTGAVDPNATYNFGTATKAQDKLANQFRAHPAATAWKLAEGAEGIRELQITLTAAGENMLRKVTIPASDLPTPEVPEKTITLIAPYRSYTRDANNNIVWHLNEVEKEYTITLGEDGVYNIKFDREYEDYKAGVYVDDLDMDIEVVVVLDTTEVPPPEPTVVVFDFGNTRKENPWVSDRTDVTNDMPALESTGGGEG